MALYRFFHRKEWPVVPTLSMWGFLSLLKELEEANDLVSHILCPREGESAKSTPRTFYNDYTADVHDDHGHSSQPRTSPSSAIWQQLD